MADAPVMDISVIMGMGIGGVMEIVGVRDVGGVMGVTGVRIVMGVGGVTVMLLG